MNLDEMKRIKHEHGLTYEMIADRSGVPLGTVQKVFTGVSKAPRYSTMKSLSRYFESLDPRTVEERYDDYLKHHYIPTDSDTSSADGKSAVSDNVNAYTAVRNEETRVRWGIPYKEQGQYTKEDYYMIPDEYRVELINGVIYQLTMLVQAGNDVMVIACVGIEEGVTGQREAIVFELERRKNNVRFEDDSIVGWNKNPYDENIKTGFLMNLAEQAEYDSMFPSHPLSQLRELVRFIVEKN